MELREKLNQEVNFISCEEKAEKWEDRRDGRVDLKQGTLRGQQRRVLLAEGIGSVCVRVFLTLR